MPGGGLERQRQPELKKIGILHVLWQKKQNCGVCDLESLLGVFLENVRTGRGQKERKIGKLALLEKEKKNRKNRIAEKNGIMELDKIPSPPRGGGAVGRQTKTKIGVTENGRLEFVKKPEWLSGKKKGGSTNRSLCPHRSLASFAVQDCTHLVLCCLFACPW